MTRGEPLPLDQALNERYLHGHAALLIVTRLEGDGDEAEVTLNFHGWNGVHGAERMLHMAEAAVDVLRTHLDTKENETQ